MSLSKPLKTQGVTCLTEVRPLHSYVLVVSMNSTTAVSERTLRGNKPWREDSMTEKEKMLAGELYDPNDEELLLLRRKAHRLSREYNLLDETDESREKILAELIPNKKSGLALQGPIQFDYGVFTSFGENCYANFNFTCIDCAPVTIGDNVFFGPNVSILTPVHPLRWQERNPFVRKDGVITDNEAAKPVTIGSNCWIAGDVTICGGVKIGEGSVIGAGSVVTRDIPPNVLAVGNPCRVIREIEN